MDPNNPEPQVTPKQQVIERVRSAANVLVTVRSNPTVDELAATIGLTLMLNKLGKHATAVFSGAVPSTIEFLKPEDTLEANTDSLRDFIVSLDKSKADKLRYKVEENVVKIFITPYRTSITEKDLEFTQGDFNIDAVIALGVTQREELDQAITAHGRILHDATVITILAGQRQSSLGAINWQDAAASSLCEMLVSISEAFQGGLIDTQMATAFLTGIVAETQRFSNTKTSPKVMTMSAQLMAAGANQQLIANELDKSAGFDPQTNNPDQNSQEINAVPADNNPSDAGTLSIQHGQQVPLADNAVPLDTMPPAQQKSENFLPPLPPSESGDSFELLTPEPVHEEPKSDEGFVLPNAQPEQPQDLSLQYPSVIQPMHPNNSASDQVHIDEHGNLSPKASPYPKHKVVEPASNSGQPPMPELNQDFSEPRQEEQRSNEPIEQKSEIISPDPPKQPESPAILDTSADPFPSASPADKPMELPRIPEAPHNDVPPVLPANSTLYEIEKTVHSPHIENPNGDPVQAAQNAVEHALGQVPYDSEHPERRHDVGAQYPDVQPNQLGSAPGLEFPNPPKQMDDFDDNGLPPPPVPPPILPQQ